MSATANLPVPASFMPKAALSTLVRRVGETARDVAGQGGARGIAKRYQNWRRMRTLTDLFAKLDQLDDAQLALLGFEREALAIELAELYDRRNRAETDMGDLAEALGQPT